MYTSLTVQRGQVPLSPLLSPGGTLRPVAALYLVGVQSSYHDWTQSECGRKCDHYCADY